MPQKGVDCGVIIHICFCFCPLQGRASDQALRETKLASTKLAAAFVETFVETLPC